MADDYIKRSDALKVIETANRMASSFLEAIMKLCVTMDRIAAADVVEVVRCKDCKYAPSGTSGHKLTWPFTNDEGYDINPCPLKCADSWYSSKPEPDFFCADGERRSNAEVY